MFLQSVQRHWRRPLSFGGLTSKSSNPLNSLSLLSTPSASSSSAPSAPTRSSHGHGRPFFTQARKPAGGSTTSLSSPSRRSELRQQQQGLAATAAAAAEKMYQEDGGPAASPHPSRVNVATARTKKSSAFLLGPEPSYVNDVEGCEIYHHRVPFQVEFGGVLPELDIAYETWGTMNEKRDNVILLTCGLSASSHARSHSKNPKPGWWENFIGPGAALDTNHFFIICVNHLGGCGGSTGPSSINPATNKPYGLDFPLFTVQDMVRVHFTLLDYLGIDRLHAVVGSSLGGMQSLCAASLYPHRVGRVVSISACIESHPMSIALRYVQRQVLMADPNFHGGTYYGKAFPWRGMQLARCIGTISYRSGPEWEERFGRQRGSASPSLDSDFIIEGYLEHQGRKWCLQYDPNSMLVISKAMDLFTLEKAATEEGVPSLEEGMKGVQMPALIMGVSSDVLFPVWQQKQVADILRAVGNRHVVYYELDAQYGHDTFLIDVASIGGAVKGHLEQRHTDLPNIN